MRSVRALSAMRNHLVCVAFVAARRGWSASDVLTSDVSVRSCTLHHVDHATRSALTAGRRGSSVVAVHRFDRGFGVSICGAACRASLVVWSWRPRLRSTLDCHLVCRAPSAAGVDGRAPDSLPIMARTWV